VSVRKTIAALQDAGLTPRLMIDTSHGNSEKDYRRQPAVAREIAAQLAQGETGIFGVMMESFILDGRQDLVTSASLAYGQSITDACMGWELTVPAIRELAEAVGARRDAVRRNGVATG
jgi:3-deoxy-7-phosphoheptulonate synthase